MSKSIAVIGTGISGLAAAYLLSKTHDVTVFEAEQRIGGHTNTFDMLLDGTTVPVDTGFIVFNTPCYPNLVALLDHLQVETAPSNMSFGVSLGSGAYEYSGSLIGFFGQPVNALRPSHWRMLRDIGRFFAEIRALDDVVEDNIPLGAWLSQRKYSPHFVDRHILPMVAAIWSKPRETSLAFPVATFARFFRSHGLLQFVNRPIWRTVRNGSRNYVTAIAQSLRRPVATGCGVQRIERRADGVAVRDRLGRTHHFDEVVIAAHADQARAMLGDPTPRENELLGAFAYSENTAVLHTDRAHMPRRRSVWSSWNYIESEDNGGHSLELTYWMNKLQPLSTNRNVFVTLNPERTFAPGSEHAKFKYAHPVFNQAAIQAQRDLWSLQGVRRTWYCGSYFGYGFHEDGLQSGLLVAEQLGGIARPWSVPDENGRILSRSLAAGGELAVAA